MEFKLIPIEKILRICIDCGLKALTEEDLDKFVKGQGHYERRNLCKKCVNKRQQKEKPKYLRKCRKCGLEAWTEEDLELFKLNYKCHYNRELTCKKCDRKRSGEYYKKNREKMNELQREWKKRNPDKVKESLARHYKTVRQLREKVIEFMGGVCIRCGYKEDIRALQIDHIHPIGYTSRKDRKNKERGRMLYLKILDHPELIGVKYQVLCANCNTIKRFEDGSNNQYTMGRGKTIKEKYKNVPVLKFNFQ